MMRGPPDLLLTSHTNAFRSRGAARRLARATSKRAAPHARRRSREDADSSRRRRSDTHALAPARARARTRARPTRARARRCVGEEEHFVWTEKDEAASKIQGLYRIKHSRERLRDAIRKNYEIGYDAEVRSSATFTRRRG